MRVIRDLIEGKLRILKELYIVLVFKRISRVSLVPTTNLSYGKDRGGSYFFVDHVLFQ